MLGLWLGDGTSIFPQITTPDKEIIEYLYKYAEGRNMLIAENGRKGDAVTLRIKKNGGCSNPFMDDLRHYDLIDNKHIPQEYISNSEKTRLELLAGLLDTDGHMERNGYEITQKNYTLAKQIKFIADTLGFRTSINEKKARCNGKDCGSVYRVYINGDVWRIPCRIERKKVLKENVHKNKDWHLSQLSIESVGMGDWCGICLDGNQRYVHSDGTITHNSGKSFNASTFIERLTFELKKFIDDDGELRKVVHNILYTRYTMSSASISVIPEFLEKIEADGTQQYFSSTRTDVTNTLTGSTIMFRGIKTSSGNQTAKLKSIHGITTFVCDEAEEWTSEKEFDTIMLSIRTKGIQNRIIIIMNPTDSNHFIYQKYIKDTHKLVEYDGVPVQISTHPNVLHIHTTYLDNKEHLSEEFIKEVELMKENNPEKYAHIVMGRWSDVAEGAIFKKWGIVDSFPAECRHVARGLDMGYTHDPSACVKVGVLNNDLYIDEQFYRTGMGTAELIRELKKDSTAVYSESADPRLVDEIAMSGVLIYPVDKSGQSILAGIEGLKDYDNIFVTKRSYNVQDELRNYTWDKDKDGNWLNIPIDKYNHACFVGETLITTDKGQVRIDQIKVGDKVLTSQGYKRVLNVFDNGIKQVVRREIVSGSKSFTLTATKDHKIFADWEWKEFSSLAVGDSIMTNDNTLCLNRITAIYNLYITNEQVYDLEVEDIHEYFANGVLVHNCDATRYWYLGKMLGKILRKKENGKVNNNISNFGF